MEPFRIKLEPQSPKKSDDIVNYNNYLKLDDVNGKLLDNLKSEYTNGIIKEEYDIPDDNHMIGEDSNNSDLENQENRSFNIESRNVHWPSKKHEQINSVQSHISTFDVSNDVASNNRNLLNDKVVDADTMNDKENQSFGKHLELNFRRCCLHCKDTREVLRFLERNYCVKCKKRMVFQCLKCNKQYDNLKGMRYHIQICGDPEKRFKCAQCDYKCSVSKLLRQHTKYNHFEGKEVECSKCNKIFKNIQSFQRHEKICGKDPTLTCTHCSYKTHKKYVLKSHIKRHEKIYQKTVQNNEAVVALDFLNDNHKQELYSGISKIQASFQRYCSKCKENFENNSFYNSNKCKNCKTKLLMRCMKCNSLHKSVPEITYHLKQHCILKTKFECSMCDHSTTRPDSLNIHIQRKHVKIDPEKFKCSECSKSFKIKDDLKRHYIRNSCMSNKLHLLCDHCPFRTIRKSALIPHIKSHFIVKTSTHPQALIFRGNKNEDNFECENCGKAFGRSSNLDCHKKVCKSNISAQN